MHMALAKGVIHLERELQLNRASRFQHEIVVIGHQAREEASMGSKAWPATASNARRS